MHRKIANTVDGCSYSFLCVLTGNCSRYSSAWEEEAAIVGDVGYELVCYRGIMVAVPFHARQRPVALAGVVARERKQAQAAQVKFMYKGAPRAERNVPHMAFRP